MLITSQVLPLKRSNFACSCMKMVDVNAKNRGGGPDLFGEKIEGEAENGTMSFTRSYQPPQHRDKEYSAMQMLLLAYQSLGVVYGDLGTSPVNVFSSTRLTNLSEEDLVGTLSLIIWTLTSLVLIKYVFVVLHADDHGEGGTFALYCYIRRHVNFHSKFSVQYARLETKTNVTCDGGGRFNLGKRIKKFLERSSTAQDFLTVLALLGTCMVIGDGALTPATCVLSALQGIQSRSSKITQDHVVWLSVVLLLALFACQRCGTRKVSFSFSPIMLMWFATNTSIGVYNIINYHPSILKAVSPHYIVKFFMNNGKTAWDLLRAVFLGITGAEAMFADLGHFNRRAIQIGFSFVVYPALVITYAGQTAYLVKNPEKITDAYYSSLPEPVYWPMFVISTLAAVVSSQSMISACFSIIKQSLFLDCFPRVNIIHTSSQHEGQVYSPEINYILMILTVGLVVGFKGGVELANAYGVVVIWVMIITTFLTSLVMLIIWKTSVVFVLAFFLPYMLIESIFMTSLLNKIPQGGWAPYAISAFFLSVMLSWTYGRSKRIAYEAEREMNIREMDQMLSSSNIYRTPGICFFFTDLVYGIPPILHHYVQNTNAVREVMVVVTTRTLPIKTVLPEDRWIVGKLGNQGVYRCLVQYGYKDSQDMKGHDYVASVVTQLEGIIDTRNEKQKIQSAAQKETVFIIGRTILKANKESGMLAQFMIDYLYRFLQKNSRSAVSTLEIPSQRTLQIGMLYEI
ncbi:potassium transporter 26-like isoform X2 [Sesamum indicum]|uniref:Potassium transporter n=1 Tax=Sesamum indicum TaxID=4182 RepID=A0A6I9SZY1_SESIN|nr:potassium transporter 26-like isoform X2 [Sesamum indicum]